MTTSHDVPRFQPQREGQTLELLAQGARFFELFGYTLAVLAFGILGGAVIWSLRVHVPEQRRSTFLVSSAAALCTLCGGAWVLLVASQPLAPRMIKSSTPRHVGGVDVVEPNEPGLQAIEIFVQADGSIHFRGQEVTLDDLIARWEQNYPDRTLSVTIRPAAETPFADVATIMGHLQENNVERFSVQIDE